MRKYRVRQCRGWCCNLKPHSKRWWYVTDDWGFTEDWSNWRSAMESTR